MQFFEKLCKIFVYGAAFWVNFPAFPENFGNTRIILQKFGRKSVKFCIKTHIFEKFPKFSMTFCTKNPYFNSKNFVILPIVKTLDKIKNL